MQKSKDECVIIGDDWFGLPLYQDLGLLPASTQVTVIPSIELFEETPIRPSEGHKQANWIWIISVTQHNLLNYYNMSLLTNWAIESSSAASIGYKSTTFSQLGRSWSIASYNSCFNSILSMFREYGISNREEWLLCYWCWNHCHLAKLYHPRLHCEYGGEKTPYFLIKIEGIELRWYAFHYPSLPKERKTLSFIDIRVKQLLRKWTLKVYNTKISKTNFQQLLSLATHRSYLSRRNFDICAAVQRQNVPSLVSRWFYRSQEHNWKCGALQEVFVH